MQSQNTKIYNLIISEDIENQNLGFLTLEKHLNNQNVIYWYIKLEPHIPKMERELYDKLDELMSKFLKFQFSISVLSKANFIMDHIKANGACPDSINAFLLLKNEITFALLTESWDGKLRKKTKSLIPCLNVL